MKLVKAVNDKIVVELVMEEKVTPGGIYIPVNADKDPQSYGIVLSVGEEVKNVKPGDLIIFHKNGGMAIMIDRKIMKVLTDREVYAVIEEEKKDVEFQSAGYVPNGDGFKIVEFKTPSTEDK